MLINVRPTPNRATVKLPLTMIDPEGKDGGASRSNLKPMLLGAILGSGLTAGAFALASHRTLGSALRADQAPPNEKWSLGSVLGMAAETSLDFFTDPNFDFGETGEKWSDAMKPAASAVDAARVRVCALFLKRFWTKRKIPAGTTCTMPVYLGVGDIVHRA